MKERVQVLGRESPLLPRRPVDGDQAPVRPRAKGRGADTEVSGRSADVEEFCACHCLGISARSRENLRIDVQSWTNRRVALERALPHVTSDTRRDALGCSSFHRDSRNLKQARGSCSYVNDQPKGEAPRAFRVEEIKPWSQRA